MKGRLKNYFPILFLLLIALLFAKLQWNKRSGSATDICFNICGDARGYYAWLPAVFIYHDLNFRFFDDLEMKETSCGAQVGIPIQDYRYAIEGKTIDKYYPGVSVMMMPFFMAAHFITDSFTQYPANGYSPVYFQTMALCGVFYYFLGMWLMLKILRKLGLNNWQMILTVAVTSFGTNAMYYAIDAPLYSHIYSFTLIAAFLYCALCLRENISAKYIALLAFLTGFLFMARPVNLSILIVLPFLLSPCSQQLLSYFKLRPARLTLFLPALIMPCILFALYKISTGHWFIYSYGKEGFDFLHPHLLQFLFSYDNGLVPYMPLLVVPVLLLFGWHKKESKYLVAGLLATIAITIYIHSSWWAWSYGFSFGARSMLDFVPLFAIMIGLSLKQAKRKAYYYLVPAYLLCAVFTALLYDQKNHGYLNKYPVTDYWQAIHHGLGIKS